MTYEDYASYNSRIAPDSEVGSAMPGSFGSSRSFTVGLLASVAVHAGGAAGLLQMSPAGESQPGAFGPRAPEPLEIPPPEPVPLVLGLEDSPHRTETWLGFVDASEHKARLATVEQAAMDPNAGGAARPPAPAKPTPEPSPQASAAPPPAQAPSEPTAPAIEPIEQSAPTQAPKSEAHQPTEPKPSSPVGPDRPEAIEPPAPPEPRQEPAALPSAPKPPAKPVEKPPTQPVEATPQAPTPSSPPSEPPAPSSAPGAEPSGERPGEKSDRESTPSALEDTIDVKPGRPAAAKGLDIKTVRPLWSDTTQLVAAPRNPVVRLTFNRAGRVSRAVFLPGQSTGMKDVDEPLLDAMYRWTAKGEALRALPATPDAGLTVQFRIMLRK